RMGVQPGDRVGLAMGQRGEAIACYMSIFSVRAIPVPLPTSLGAGRIEGCLRYAQARVALADPISGPDILQAHMRYPELSQIVGLGFQHDDIIPWRTLLARQPTVFKPTPVSASRPALLFYSGESGSPVKGTVVTH